MLLSRTPSPPRGRLSHGEPQAPHPSGGPRTPPAPLRVREGNGGQTVQEDTGTRPGPTPHMHPTHRGHIQLLGALTLDEGPGATVTKSHTRGDFKH